VIIGEALQPVNAIASQAQRGKPIDGGGKVRLQSGLFITAGLRLTSYLSEAAFEKSF
jgi:hypothetical protein